MLFQITLSTDTIFWFNLERGSHPNYLINFSFEWTRFITYFELKFKISRWKKAMLFQFVTQRDCRKSAHEILISFMLAKCWFSFEPSQIEIHLDFRKFFIQCLWIDKWWMVKKLFMNFYESSFSVFFWEKYLKLDSKQCNDILSIQSSINLIISKVKKKLFRLEKLWYWSKKNQSIFKHSW
jgi:hypothetical protein